MPNQRRRIGSADRPRRGRAALALCLFGAAVVAGCKTAGSHFSAWRPIEAEASLLEVRPRAGQEMPDIVRRERRSGAERQELWAWNSGELLVSAVFPGRHYRSTFESESTLRRIAASWRRLERLGVTLDDADIRTGRNSLGQYRYALAYSSTGHLRCFVFLQATHHQSPGDYGGVSAAGGYTSGYNCINTRGTSAEAQERNSLDYLAGLSLRE